jgi:serine/threonine protein kinase
MASAEPSQGSGRENSAAIRLEVGAEPISGYRLVREVGRGGSGEVWHAIDQEQRAVALKFMRLGSRLPGSEASFLKLLQEIRHPHLLPIFGGWECPGFLVLCMELADFTLMDRFEKETAKGLPGIPFADLVRYMEEAASGIDFLNESQHLAPDSKQPGPVPSGDTDEQFALRLGSIQHRDIKPQNLFLVNGQVKVADFGLAKFTEHTVTKHSGAVTVAYAAPEFFRGKTTNRSDQYSLAVSYCQLRSGRLPFRGTPAQLMAGHLARPPDLSMLPEDERPAVGRALLKKPDERWPSCSAFVEILRATAAGGIPSRSSVSPAGNAGSRGKVPSQSTAPASMRGDPARRSAAARAESRARMAGILLVVAIFALFLSLGILAIILGRRDPSPAEAKAKEPEKPAPIILPDPEAVAALKELGILRQQLKAFEERLALLKEEKKELAARVQSSEERVQKIKGKLRDKNTVVDKMQAALVKEMVLREAEKKQLDSKQVELDKLQSELEKLKQEKTELDQKVRALTPVEVKTNPDKLQLSWPSLLQEKFPSHIAELKTALEILEDNTLSTREKLARATDALSVTAAIQKGLAKYAITDRRANEAKSFVEELELKLYRLRR